VTLGFAGGPTVTRRMTAEHLEALRSALDGDAAWHELRTEHEVLVISLRGWRFSSSTRPVAGSASAERPEALRGRGEAPARGARPRPAPEGVLQVVADLLARHALTGEAHGEQRGGLVLVNRPAGATRGRLVRGRGRRPTTHGG
jgi:hypothetical protein